MHQKTLLMCADHAGAAATPWQTRAIAFGLGDIRRSPGSADPVAEISRFVPVMLTSRFLDSGPRWSDGRVDFKCDCPAWQTAWVDWLRIPSYNETNSFHHQLKPCAATITDLFEVYCGFFRRY